MPTIDEMYADLAAADAAGDYELANAIAARIKSSSKPQAKPVAAKPLQTPAEAAVSAAGGALRDLAAGAVRGAGSIGATLVAPGDWIADRIYGDREPGVGNLVTGKAPETRNEERRRKIDEGLAQLTGANTDSIQYAGGKVAGEVLGTLGVAPSVGARVATVAPRLGQAIATGGFRAGGATGAGGMLTRMAGGAIGGGASAGLVDPEMATTGAAVGGLLPPAAMAVGRTAQAAGRAVRGGGASPEAAALARRAGELGIEIPADRVVNSKPLNAAASALNYVPFSGRAATEEKMVQQLGRAAARLVGQDSDNLPTALRRASDDLGAKFDDVLKNNSVAVDQQFLDELAEISQQAQKELGADGLKAIGNQVDEIIAKGESGALDGQAAYNIKRVLDRIGKRNSPEAFHALELKRSLMGALDRSIGPEKAAEFAKVRKQYSNLIALEKIARNGVDGEISVARLANMRNIGNKDLQEIADIAEQFVKPRESQHGAMQRAVVGLGAGTYAGLPWLAGGAAAGRAANAALNSGAMREFMMQQPSQQTAQGILEQIAGKDGVPLLLRAAPVVSAR